MHDNAALAKFRRDPEIPNDIIIECLREHEVAATVKGNDNHIHIRVWLIHHVGLQFPVSPY